MTYVAPLAQEATSRVITLNDYSQNEVEMLLEFIYGGGPCPMVSLISKRFGLTKGTTGNQVLDNCVYDYQAPLGHNPARANMMERSTTLWNLGDYFLVSDLKEYAIRELIRHTDAKVFGFAACFKPTEASPAPPDGQTTPRTAWAFYRNIPGASWPQEHVKAFATAIRAAYTTGPENGPCRRILIEAIFTIQTTLTRKLKDILVGLVAEIEAFGRDLGERLLSDPQGPWCLTYAQAAQMPKLRGGCRVNHHEVDHDWEGNLRAVFRLFANAPSMTSSGLWCWDCMFADRDFSVAPWRKDSKIWANYLPMYLVD